MQIRLKLTQRCSLLCYRFGAIVVTCWRAFLCSLRQSMKTGRATPTDGSIESTVFADVETLKVNGASVRVYDCAGQVFYGCAANVSEFAL